MRGLRGMRDGGDKKFKSSVETTALEEKAFMEDVGGHRKLYNACGVAGWITRGTFCYTYCGRGRRLEEVTDTLDLQRLLEETVLLYIPRGRVHRKWRQYRC
jgi:hypothetical protein